MDSIGKIIYRLGSIAIWVGALFTALSVYVVGQERWPSQVWAPAIGVIIFGVIVQCLWCWIFEKKKESAPQRSK